ncbi:MAG: ATPase domain-containing protein [Spirochaetales bacterium]|nr:ATPase domain-containing protein [Spirochaetales bacterium]
MAKKKSIVYKCSSCGNIQPRWLGRCPECNEWNTFEEFVQNEGGATVGGIGLGNKVDSKGNRIPQKPVSLSKISPLEGDRLFTGIEEFDRVLGGGAMLKSVILIGGEPGIGKSTLLLQTASKIANGSGVTSGVAKTSNDTSGAATKSVGETKSSAVATGSATKPGAVATSSATKSSAVATNGATKPGADTTNGATKSSAVTTGSATKSSAGHSVLYVSGEESANQSRSRSDRLGLNCDNIQILCTSILDDIENALNTLNPTFVVIDSIQTVYSAEAGVVPGTVNQLKYCANELISWVKEHNCVMLMVAHITKEGTIAGPKSLEHMVDTVISFEKNNDDVRFLRCQKNRFGSIDELGIFSMQEKGLVPIEDTSSMFITKRNGNLPAGVAIVPVFEGSRVFMVEIQALTVPAKASLSRVYSEKIDNARVSRVAAVIEKCMGLKFSDQDIYINVAGGIKLTESAIDAALCASLYSARTGISFPEKTAVVGELSLAGEIRAVSKLKQRIKNATSLGFSTVITPEKEDSSIAVTDVKQMIKKLFG